MLAPERFRDAWLAIGATYVVFQLERGEEETPHYQGYAEFAKKKTYNAVKNKLADYCNWHERFEIHFEKRFGTQQEAVAYCEKEDSRKDGPWKGGALKEGAYKGARNDITPFKDALKAGKRNRELIEEFPLFCAKYPKFMNLVRESYRPALRSEPTTVVLRHGSTGVGKTRSTWLAHDADANDLYVNPIQGTGFWMDAYDQQQHCLLDDFAGAASHVNLTQVLRLLDRYPVLVPIKGSHVWWYPKQITITTNIHPRGWYKWARREEQYRALMRRITGIFYENMDVPLSPAECEKYRDDYYNYGYEGEYDPRHQETT